MKIAPKDRSVLPADEYLLQIKKIEWKRKKDDSEASPYINVECVVLEGDAEGFHMFEIFSTNPRAVFRLEGLLKATGVTKEFNTNDEDWQREMRLELLGRTFRAKVTIQTDEQYGDKNRISRIYKPKENDQIPDRGDIDGGEDMPF